MMQQSELIKVDYLHNQDAQSTIVRINHNSTAADICVPLSSKINIPSEDLRYFSLIFKYSIVFASGTRHHCVKTVRPKDKVIEVRSKLVEKQNRSFAAEAKISCKSNWYFKDTRSPPLVRLNFDNTSASDADFSTAGSSSAGPSSIAPSASRAGRIPDGLDQYCSISGDSSSDDERPISSGDLSYLLSFDRKAVMLRRSAKDPNLWKDRTIILSDKLWCVNVRKSRAFSVPLSENTKIIDKFGRSFSYSTVFSISSGNVDASPSETISTGELSKGELYLCTESASELNAWADDIKYFLYNNVDNDQIRLGELLIEDQDGYHVNRSLQQMKKQYDNILATNMILAEIQKQSSLSSVLCLNDISKPKVSKLKQVQRNDEILHLAPCVCPYDTFKPPNFSFFHNYHECRSRESEMIGVLAAMHRFKDLQRQDRISPKRQWFSVVSIYHKYILPQLTMALKDGRQDESNRPSSNPIPNYPSSKDGNSSINLASRNSQNNSNLNFSNSSSSGSSSSSSSMRGRSISEASPGLKSGRTRVYSEGFNPSDDLNVSENNNNSNSNSNGGSINSRGRIRKTSVDLSSSDYWNTPSAELLKIHGLIFKNIRKQVAGAKDIDGVRQSMDPDNAEVNNSEEAVPDSVRSRASLSEKASMGTSPISPTHPPSSAAPSFLGYLWSWSGASSAQTEIPTSVDSNRSGGGAKSSASTWSGLTSYDVDPIITLAPNQSRGKSSQKSPLYQILDLLSRPPPDIFDALILQIEEKLDFQSEFIIQVQEFKEAFVLSDDAK